MKIKDLAQSERPREKLRFHGAEILSDAELIAVIIGNGITGSNALDVSNRLLSRFSIDMISGCSVSELITIRGIGTAKAMQITAVFELIKRIRSGNILGMKVTCSSDIALHYIEKLKHMKKEYFIAVFLDSKNRIIRDKVVFIGTLNSSLVHPREVFREAIINSANSLILVHNHPSGNCEPSDEDIMITKLFHKTGKIIGIEMLDHIIVGYDTHWSWNSKC